MKFIFSKFLSFAYVLSLFYLVPTQPSHAEELDSLRQTTVSPAISITVKRVDLTNNTLNSDTGGSVYKINQSDIEDMSLGANTPLNQVLLQAPGVAQDSFGQVHVRGEHGNMQYRINGVIIPESIAGFGQSIDTRYFEQMNLITGALPAEYGNRTAGVIDIHTKSGHQALGGSMSLLVGQYGNINPSLEYGGTEGNLDYYFTGQLLHNDLGIESPTSARNPIHDATSQIKGFGYLSYLLDDGAKLTGIFGSAVSHFQIPNKPNQAEAHLLSGVSIASANLNENQKEQTHYGVVAYQGKYGLSTDYQVSLFSRYTEITFNPDNLGDLIYNGVASKVLRSNLSTGLQGDITYRVNESHTLRYGLTTSLEHAVNNNTSSVFPTGGSDSAYAITDNHSKNASLTGLYIQDKWLMADQLIMNYGLRLDHVNAYVQEGQISPRIGVVYQLLPQTTLHAGYARYFTPPPTELVSSSTVALFQGTTNASETTQNDTVKSERSNYYDIGVTHSPISSWTIGLDAYYKDVSHLLDEGQFGQALVFTPFNYSKGRVYGLELTNSYHEGNLGGYFNIALSRALGKNIESAQFNFGQSELNFIANHWVHLDHDQVLTASGGATYQMDKTVLAMNAIFGSGMRSGFANTSSLPAYTTFNFSVGRAIDTTILGVINTKLALINAFDHSYEIRDGSGIGVGAPQFGQRRSLLLSISKDF